MQPVQIVPICFSAAIPNCTAAAEQWMYHKVIECYIIMFSYISSFPAASQSFFFFSGLATSLKNKSIHKFTNKIIPYSQEISCSSWRFLSLDHVFNDFFDVIQVSTHTKDECRLTIISCLYLQMGYQTKIRPLYTKGTEKRITQLQENIPLEVLQKKANIKKNYETDSQSTKWCFLILIRFYAS